MRSPSEADEPSRMPKYQLKFALNTFQCCYPTSDIRMTLTLRACQYSCKVSDLHYSCHFRDCQHFLDLILSGVVCQQQTACLTKTDQCSSTYISLSKHIRLNVMVTYKFAATSKSLPCWLSPQSRCSLLLVQTFSRLRLVYLRCHSEMVCDYNRKNLDFIGQICCYCSHH